MKTVYQLPPMTASTITHCYDSARAALQFARDVAADKTIPVPIQVAFTDVAATLRSPIERIERGIPSVKQQEFNDHIRDTDPLIFQNIQYLYSRMTKDKKELLELCAEHILKGGRIEFEDEKVKQITEMPSYEQIMENVIDFISQAKGIELEELEGKSRQRDIAYCRHLCIYVAKKKTYLTLNALANRFGGRDHTTAMHSFQTIQDLMDTEDAVREEVEYFMGIDYVNYQGELKEAV